MFRHKYRFTSLAVSCCLLFLLAACAPFGSANSGSTPTLGISGAAVTASTGGATAIPTTASMPATQTACPAKGTARAAVYAPLVVGSHQNIVYIFNQFASPGNSGEIKRYDTSTGKKFILVNAPKSLIGEAQISPDRQWVLFTTGMPPAVALQLVRMDGQGLQTLYCSYTEQFALSSIAWSPDQKTVAFMDGNEVDLLELATGHLQVLLVEPTTGIWASPATWLDDTHIYMTSFVPYSNAPQQSLYVLDTAKGEHQQVSDLIKVYNYSGYCLSFDSSLDNSKLFISTCHATGPGNSITQQGPSAIIAEPALGGLQTTVYTNPTLAIATLRVISSTTMLLLIQNLTGDTSKNGLWKINLDGAGLTRLTTAGAGQMSSLNETSEFPWSNVSRDASMYALKTSSNNDTNEALLIGSLGGASPTTFATVSHTAGSVSIVGWTTM
jgi:hypothetical protein